jgi:tripartite ATP-independent transporter DctP family solute receptor
LHCNQAVNIEEVIMTYLQSLIASALAASVALLSGNANAQISERTLRWAQQNSLEHPQGQGAKKFAEVVEQKSGGKIKVRVFPSGQLGGDLPNISALQGGTLDLMVLNAGLLSSNVKDFAVFDLPFLFNTPEEADAVADGPVGQKMFDKLQEKGLVGLGYFDLGFRNVTNSKRPISKLEDFSGIKLRVLQSPLFIDLFNTLGANTVAMPFPEVYTALEQKVIDGQENPFTVIRDSKFSEVQPYLSITRHVYNPQSVIMSKRTWDKLSADEKKIVQEAADEAEVYQRKVSREQAAKALEDLTKAGMKVNEIAPQEMARIREKVKPIIDKYAKEVGEPLVAEVNGEIAKKRGTN